MSYRSKEISAFFGGGLRPPETLSRHLEIKKIMRSRRLHASRYAVNRLCAVLPVTPGILSSTSTRGAGTLVDCRRARLERSVSYLGFSVEYLRGA